MTQHESLQCAAHHRTRARPSASMRADEDDATSSTRARDANPMWTVAPRVAVSSTTRPTGERTIRSTVASTTETTVETKTRPPAGARAREDDRERWHAGARVDGDAAASAAAPRDWRESFSRATFIRANGGRFKVYSRGSFDDDLDGDEFETRAVLFMLHGCPYTALTWAPTVEEIARRAAEDGTSVAASVDAIAMDLRGHGESDGGLGDDRGDNGATFDPDVMALDAFETLGAFLTRSKRRVVVIGHSMGGAIAARCAALIENANRESSSSYPAELAGLVLVDIVEGSALSALPAMGALVDSRPSEFATLEDAMRWSSSRGGGTTNTRSASVSLPSQLRKVVAADGSSKYVWITDLRATAPFWTSWYRGLSGKFLAVKAPKLLLLAGNDRLDTELTIAQMQGRFQMTVCKAGHCVQEDDPDAVATTLENFVSRYVSRKRPTPPPFM